MRRLICLAVLLLPTFALADHIGPHATPCNAADIVGGGALGLSPGPVGPPGSLGWDVGNGQCNGGFTATNDAGFPGGALELALRAEQRSVGQVARIGADEYEVQLGHDTTSGQLNRAWWNFQASVAYGGPIEDLDSLVFDIETISGPNAPAAFLPLDMIAARGGLDARNSQPNPTLGFADLYQFSQNPEFTWFVAGADADANPNGNFDYGVEGAWRMTVTATEGGVERSVSVCIRTPGATCEVVSVPGFSNRAAIATGILLTLAICLLVALRARRAGLA